MDHGRTLGTMIDVFTSIGYKTKYKVLNAWGLWRSRKASKNDLNWT